MHAVDLYLRSYSLTRKIKNVSKKKTVATVLRVKLKMFRKKEKRVRLLNAIY